MRLQLRRYLRVILQTLISILFPILTLSSCTKKVTTPKSPQEDGRLIYARHCTACHSVNPMADGILGPAIYGSSLELLQAKLITGGYPANYQPKRNTKQMVPLPFLKDEIPALHAYLNKP